MACISAIYMPVKRGREGLSGRACMHGSCVCLVYLVCGGDLVARLRRPPWSSQRMPYVCTALNMRTACCTAGYGLVSERGTSWHYGT